MAHTFLDLESLPHASFEEIRADIEAAEEMLAKLREMQCSTYEQQQEHEKDLAASERHLDILYNAQLTYPGW